MRSIEVVVVASPEDPHAVAVSELLTDKNVQILDTHKLVGQPVRHGRSKLVLGDGRYSVDNRTSVWWRRPGLPGVEGLEAAEASLVIAESHVILVGALAASDARWIDNPWVVDRAENKLVQLSVASKVGISIPEYLVTNDVDTACRFLEIGPTVAKRLSSGPGIAPFVEPVTRDDMSAVSRAPVLLQHLVNRSADLRIVTVGSEAFCWRRTFDKTDPVDWRRIDPDGTGFKACSQDLSNGGAKKIAENLGITFSSQDWLLGPDGPVFLEANPQGNWLFLAGARESIAPAMARHLLGNNHGG